MLEVEELATDPRAPVKDETESQLTVICRLDGETRLGQLGEGDEDARLEVILLRTAPKRRQDLR